MADLGYIAGAFGIGWISPSPFVKVKQGDGVTLPGGGEK